MGLVPCKTLVFLFFNDHTTHIVKNNIKKQVKYCIFFVFLQKNHRFVNNLFFNQKLTIMKKITTLFLVVMTLCFIACSSESEETQTTSVQSNELITQGRKFANIHNDCLENIYNSLISSKTRSTSTHKFSKSEVVKAANQYIAQHVSKTRANADENYITEKTYEISIEDIREQIPEYELNYIEKILSTDGNNENILKDIINDNKLTISKKKAIICFSTTYNASSEYWQKNIYKWNNNIKKVPVTRAIRFNWKEVAFADAYWGYTGMLSSGLNVWVGGGAAAVGSALSCLK